MKKYIFLSSLFFSLSVFSSDKISFQEDYGKASAFLPDGVSILLDEKIQNIKTDFHKITFNDVLEAWKDRKILKLDEEEYVVLQREPKLKTTLHKNQEFVAANPCYTFGLGPYLLKQKDLENLPRFEDNVNWVLYNLSAIEYKKHTFITARFTAYNNPHWNTRFVHPEPFKDLNNRYWHTESCIDTIEPIRTVNFILQEVKTSF